VIGPLFSACTELSHSLLHALFHIFCSLCWMHVCTMMASCLCCASCSWTLTKPMSFQNFTTNFWRQQSFWKFLMGC
jgi:hypothetical protein